jgi:perosamine synthetase
MDMDLLARRLETGPPLAAVVTVHYMGTPADMAALERLQRRHGFAIVEDCAHGPLIRYADADGVWRHAGSRNTGCFSFHTLKPISCGDGGAVTVADPEAFRRLRRLRWYGAISTADRERDNRYSWDYGIEELGFKAYMNDITAAMARAQMVHAEAEHAVRAAHWVRYGAGLDPAVFQPVPHGPGSSYYLAVFRLAGIDRAALIAALAGRGIHAGVHYKPINGYPGTRGPGETPAAQAFFERIVSLPLHHNHTADEIETVIAAANDAARALAATRPAALASR